MFVLGAESHFVGTHKGDFLGIAPSGKDVRFPFTVVVQFADGLLSGEEFYYDLNDLMHQLCQDSFKVAA